MKESKARLSQLLNEIEGYVSQKQLQFQEIHSKDAIKIQAFWRKYRYLKALKQAYNAHIKECKLRKCVSNYNKQILNIGFVKYKSIISDIKISQTAKKPIPMTPVRASNTKRNWRKTTPCSSKSTLSSSNVRSAISSKNSLNQTYEYYNSIQTFSSKALKPITKGKGKSKSISSTNKYNDCDLHFKVGYSQKKARTRVICKDKASPQNSSFSLISKYVDVGIMTDTHQENDKIIKLHQRYMLKARLSKIDEEAKSTHYSPEKPSARPLCIIDTNSKCKINEQFI